MYKVWNKMVKIFKNFYSCWIPANEQKKIEEEKQIGDWRNMLYKEFRNKYGKFKTIRVFGDATNNDIITIYD